MSVIKKIGIAGLGHIGKRHLAQYKALGFTAFTADPMIEGGEAAALGSAGHYAGFEEMLQDAKPDAVSICLPSSMHRESALLAFAHGAHVLMEKPFALTLEDIDVMLTAAKAQARRIMVAHVCRFMPQNEIAKEIIGNGSLGKPVFLNAWRDCATPGWSAQNWLGDRSASGGTVMDLQIHEIDLAQWFLGPVRDVALLQRQGGRFEGSGFSHVISNLSFESGAAAVLEAGHLMPDGYPLNNGYRLVFEGGVLECSHSPQVSVLLYEKGKMTDLTQQYQERREGRDPYCEEIRHFTGCIESGEEFIVSPLDAKRAVETVLKLTENEILKNLSCP